MTNGTRDSTIWTFVVIFLGLLLVFESTSGDLRAHFRHQLILQVRVETSEFKDDIQVDDTSGKREFPFEQLETAFVTFGSYFFSNLLSKFVKHQEKIRW